MVINLKEQINFVIYIQNFGMKIIITMFGMKIESIVIRYNYVLSRP